MNWQQISVGATIAVILLSGCSLLPGHIKLGGNSVTAVKDAGRPATIATGDKTESIPLPDGSSLTITKFEAQAEQITKDGKAVTPAAPAKTVTEIHLAGASQLTTTEKTVAANTGTVDTTVANHRIDETAKEPLLYCAIACVLVAVAMLYFEHPAAAGLSAAAAAALFAAWRMPDLPEWFWMLGAIGIAGALCLVFGHAKGVANSTATSATVSK